MKLLIFLFGVVLGISSGRDEDSETSLRPPSSLQPQLFLDVTDTVSAPQHLAGNYEEMMKFVFQVIGKGWEQVPRGVGGSRGWNIGSVVAYEYPTGTWHPIAWGLNSVALNGGWAHGERLMLDVLDTLAEILGVTLHHLTWHLTLFTNLQPCWMCTTELAVRAQFREVVFTMLDKGKSDSDKICLTTDERAAETEALFNDKKTPRQTDDLRYACLVTQDYILRYIKKDDGGFVRNPRSADAFVDQLEVWLGAPPPHGPLRLSMFYVGPSVVNSCTSRMAAAFDEVFLPNREFPWAFLDDKVQSYYTCLVKHANSGEKVLLKDVNPYSSQETGKRNAGFFLGNLPGFLLEAGGPPDAMAPIAPGATVNEVLESVLKLSDTFKTTVDNVIGQM